MYKSNRAFDDDDEYNYGMKRDDEYEGYESPDDGMDNDGGLDIDEKGFEQRMEGEEDIFYFKRMDLPGFPRNEEIKKLAVSEEAKVIISKSNRIYRWRNRAEPEFRQHELPDQNK